MLQTEVRGESVWKTQKTGDRATQKKPTHSSYCYRFKWLFNEVQNDRHVDPMLWQRELFLVLKIDSGRLRGGEGGVDFHHGGQFKAPVTLQFEWLGKWKRWSELERLGDARTREDRQNTPEWQPQVVWHECLTQLRNKAAKQSRNRAPKQHQLFAPPPIPVHFMFFCFGSSALAGIFRTLATVLLL